MRAEKCVRQHLLKISVCGQSDDGCTFCVCAEIEGCIFRCGYFRFDHEFGMHGPVNLIRISLSTPSIE